MRKLYSLVACSILVCAVAACGGSGSPTSTSPAAPAAAPMAQPASSAEPASPPPAAPMMMPLTATPDDRIGTVPPGVGLKVGTKAPTATLPDITGKNVELASLYAQGPTFIIFYRGGWCPFCNSQLHALTQAKPEFDRRGVHLVAISVDSPGQEAKTQASLGVPFPMLSDSKLTVQTAFNVVHTPPAQELTALSSYGIDLESYSGEQHHKFAIPSIFLIERGVIRFVHVDEEYKTRPTTQQLLAVADRLLNK